MWSYQSHRLFISALMTSPLIETIKSIFVSLLLVGCMVSILGLGFYTCYLIAQGIKFLINERYLPCLSYNGLYCDTDTTAFVWVFIFLAGALIVGLTIFVCKKLIRDTINHIREEMKKNNDDMGNLKV